MGPCVEEKTILQAALMGTVRVDQVFGTEKQETDSFDIGSAGDQGKGKVGYEPSRVPHSYWGPCEHVRFPFIINVWSMVKITRVHK